MNPVSSQVTALFQSNDFEASIESLSRLEKTPKDFKRGQEIVEITVEPTGRGMIYLDETYFEFIFSVENHLGNPVKGLLTRQKAVLNDDETPKKNAKGEDEFITEIVHTKDNVSLINYIVWLAWSNLNVQFESEPVYSAREHTTGLVEYTNIIQQLQTNQSTILSKGFVLDTPGYHDDINYLVGANQGGRNRSKWIEDGGKIRVRSKLPIGLARTGAALPPGISVKFSFELGRPEYSILTTELNERFKIVLEDIKVDACCVKLTPEAFLGIEECLSSKPAKYQFEQDVVLITDGIDKGKMDTSKKEIYSGQLPKNIKFIQIPALAHIGDYEKNPLNFKVTIFYILNRSLYYHSPPFLTLILFYNNFIQS